MALVAGLGESPALFQSPLGLWVAYLVQARLGAASELSLELLQLSERLGIGDLALLAHLAAVCSRYWSGQPSKVLSHAEKGMTLYDQGRHEGHKLLFQDPAVTVLSHQALALWLLGYPDQANEKSAKSIVLARVVGHPFSLSVALEWDAFLRSMRQEPNLVADRAT